MSYVERLIDKAAEKCGGVEALCSRLDFSRQYLHNVKKGKTPLSIELAGRLAAIAEANVQHAIFMAGIEQVKRSAHAKEIMEALERGFLALALVAFGIFATESDGLGTTMRVNYSVDGLYIVSITMDPPKERVLTVRSASCLGRASA